MLFVKLKGFPVAYLTRALGAMLEWLRTAELELWRLAERRSSLWREGRGCGRGPSCVRTAKLLVRYFLKL